MQQEDMCDEQIHYYSNISTGTKTSKPVPVKLVKFKQLNYATM